MKVLIKNCNLISVSEGREKYEKGIDILIKDNYISKIGKNIEIDDKTKVIDAKNKIVMPGFINTHTHVAMSIFRDTLDGLGLQDWLNKKIWPMEAKLTKEDIYYASYLSCMEMIKTGTTTFNDQYFMADSTIKAVLETGLNMHTTRTIMDVAGDRDIKLRELEDLINKYNNKYDNININVGIHGLYTTSRECVEKAVELARKYNLYIHMHFAENTKEIEDIKKMHKTDYPVSLLEEYFKGINLVLAHCVKIDENDMNKLDKKFINVAHCPVSNLRLGCGVAKVESFLDNSINVSLGTDGQGSGSNLDMFETMRLTTLLQKGINEDATCLPAYEVIKMATINGAKTLGIDNKTGSIEEGKNADLIILDLNSITTQPINDIFSNIVYNAKGNNVITTISNGKILMENRKTNLKNEKEIYSKCDEIINCLSNIFLKCIEKNVNI